MLQTLVDLGSHHGRKVQGRPLRDLPCLRPNGTSTSSSTSAASGGGTTVVRDGFGLPLQSSVIVFRTVSIPSYWDPPDWADTRGALTLFTASPGAVTALVVYERCQACC